MGDIKQETSRAREHADNFMAIAERIKELFDMIDSIMKELYGDNWIGSGAEHAKASYDQHKAKYETFYAQLSNFKPVIYQVAATYEERSKSAGNRVALD